MERSQHRMAQHAGRDVADTQDRVAPTAVRVLMIRQPRQAAIDHCLPSLTLSGHRRRCHLIGRLHRLEQRHDGRGGGQRGRRSFSRPPTMLVPPSQQHLIHAVDGLLDIG